MFDFSFLNPQEKHEEVVCVSQCSLCQWCKRTGALRDSRYLVGGHSQLTTGVMVVLPSLVSVHYLAKASAQSSDELQPPSNYLDF